MSLSVLAFLVSIGTVAGLLKLGTSAIDTNTVSEQADETITPVVSSDELTVELGSEPVFAVLPVEVTVEQATEAGYTLTAFAESTDLVSTTDESKTIPMIAVDEGELAALTDNTYGLALAKPESKDEEIYTTLSTDADNPTFITDKDYEKTEANDTTTIYYGFYITPDTPYGTYTSGNVYYDVEANPLLATIVYNGKGLYFNGDDTQTTNTVKYDIVTTTKTSKISHTPNVSDDGTKIKSIPYGTTTNEVVTIPGASRLSVSLTYGSYNLNYGFATLWSGSHPDWTASGDYGKGIQSCDGSTVADGRFGGGGSETTVTATCSVNSDTVTFAYWAQPGGGPSIGYGYYAVVTGYDADGNIVYLKENSPMVGEYLIPSSNAYSRFIGWATSEEATTPAYTTEESIETELGLTLGETTQLYAIWEPAFSISYNGNGADATTNMDNVEQYTSNLDGTSQVDLLASNFKKGGYGFAGWSTDQDAASKINNTGDDKPTIYGPNQMITIDENLIAEAGENRKLVLNAVWVPAETGVTMQTFNPNSEPYASKPNGTVIALKDERDNEVYAVAKLADGNYWMIENLRLDNEPELSANNTHNPNLPLTNNYEEQIKTNKLSASSDSWCNSWSTTEEQIACYDHSNLNTNNVANTVASPSFSQDFTSSTHSNFEGNIASYGNYYNWYSATAGQGTRSVSSGNATGDICPAGWILPIGNKTDAKGSFSHLDTSMGGTGEGQGSTEASNRWRSFPNNFVYSGNWNGSSAGSRGGYGYYWSSTASYTSSAYALYFYSDYVNPGTYGYGKYGGYSVRCVAPVR